MKASMKAEQAGFELTNEYPILMERQKALLIKHVSIPGPQPRRCSTHHPQTLRAVGVGGIDAAAVTASATAGPVWSMLPRSLPRPPRAQCVGGANAAAKACTIN